MTPFQTVATYLPQLMSSIESSTQSEPVKAAWAAFMEQHTFANLGRAEALERTRQIRSSKIVAAICQADAALPRSLTRLKRADEARRRLLIHPTQYGLKRAPSLRTVRKTVRALLESERQARNGTMEP
jgi:hypothetical protein